MNCYILKAKKGTVFLGLKASLEEEYRNAVRFTTIGEAMKKASNINFKLGAPVFEVIPLYD